MSLQSIQKLNKIQKQPSNKNKSEQELVQSKILNQNPYAELIQQIKQYMIELQKQKSSQEKEKITQSQSKNKLQSQSQLQQRKDIPISNDINKESQINKKIVLSPQQKINILKKRLQLLGNKMGYTSLRLDNLQKIFSHYCSYIFKAGKHVTFDRIQYEKAHLIMERYFAFIHDFQLNKIIVDQQEKQLINKQDLILIFKRASSNSRNLEFSQFLSVIQRLAVSHYDCQIDYQARIQKIKADRQKFKNINQKRKKQKQRKQKQKIQKEEAIRLQFQKIQQQSIQTNAAQQKAKQQQKEKADLQQFKLEMFKKKSKAKKKGGKPESPQKSKKQNQSIQNQEVAINNDDLVNKMMEDDQLQNPNKQFQKLQINSKNQEKKTIEKIEKQKNQDELLELTKQEKVQIFLNLLQIDDLNAIQNKLRKFEHPLYKQLNQEQKSQNLLNSSKLREKQIKNQLRLGQLKQKIKEREKQKLKSSIVKSISVQKYQMKKKVFHDRYMRKALRDLDAQHQKQRATYRRRDQGVQLSLEILNNSSADKIQMKNNPIRFLVPEEDDNIFLDQYGGYDKKLRRSISSFSKQHNGQKSPKNNDQIVDDLKKRAQQLQQVQKKYEEHKLSRFALQMYKNQHYMRKFLQKKW